MTFNTIKICPFGLLLQAKNHRLSINVLDVDRLRELARTEHLILLRGFQPLQDTNEFTAYCERWGKIDIWPFGKVLELLAQENPQDHIFDHLHVPLHWDGMYREQIPEFQIFRCVKAPLPGQGGRTTFANTVLALKSTPTAQKKIWEKVTGIYQRKMAFYDSITVSPIINKHPFNDFYVIRYNEPPDRETDRFLNPSQLEFTGLASETLEEFHRSLRKALYAPDNFYAHQWLENDVVIADNFSLLHGREKFLSGSPRHLQRVHISSNPPFANPGLKSCT